MDDDGVRYLNSVSKTVKTKLDVPEGQTIVHYCTCSKAFIPEAALWVPEKAYEYGRQFIKDRNGDLSQS